MKITALQTFVACIAALLLAPPAAPPVFAAAPDLVEGVLTPSGMARLVELTCSVAAANQSQIPAKRFIFRVTTPPSGLTYQRARSFPVPQGVTKLHESGVGHYVEFHFPVPASSRVTHEVKSHVLLLPVDYARRRLSGHPRDPKLTAYLSPSKLIESDAPEIVAVAKQILAGKTTDLEKARTAFQYPAGLIRFRPQEPAGALKALQTRSGDCTEFAALFCALCRAGGVPARMTGVFNMDSKAEITSSEPNHNAAEAFIAGWGWVPVDPNLGEGKFDRTIGFARTGNSVILLSQAGAWVWSTWLPPDDFAEGATRPAIRVEVLWKMRVLGEGPSAQMLQQFEESSGLSK